MIMVEGQFADRGNELTIRPDVARELAAELEEAARRSENEGVQEIQVVTVGPRHFDLKLRVNPDLG